MITPAGSNYASSLWIKRPCFFAATPAAIMYQKQHGGVMDIGWSGAIHALIGLFPLGDVARHPGTGRQPRGYPGCRAPLFRAFGRPLAQRSGFADSRTEQCTQRPIGHIAHEHGNAQPVRVQDGARPVPVSERPPNR